MSQISSTLEGDWMYNLHPVLWKNLFIYVEDYRKYWFIKGGYDQGKLTKSDAQIEFVSNGIWKEHLSIWQV